LPAAIALEDEPATFPEQQARLVDPVRFVHDGILPADCVPLSSGGTFPPARRFVEVDRTEKRSAPFE
jgi:hypothetical protein